MMNRIKDIVTEYFIGSETSKEYIKAIDDTAEFFSSKRQFEPIRLNAENQKKGFIYYGRAFPNFVDLVSIFTGVATGEVLIMTTGLIFGESIRGTMTYCSLKDIKGLKRIKINLEESWNTSRLGFQYDGESIERFLDQ